jgi:putative flippase GtrA
VTSLVTRTHRGSRRLTEELAKFGVIGAANTALDIALFNVLLQGPLEGAPMAAKAISIVVAATSSYFMNRHWTWGDRPHTGVRREYVLFLLVSAVGLGLNLAVLGVSHHLLGLTSTLADNVSGNVVGLGLAMAWRFWALRTWVFRQR